MGDQGVPAYESPPAYAPPPPYAGRVKRPTCRRRVITAAAGLAVLLAAVLAYVLGSSGPSAAKTPQQAVKRLLDAGTKNDVKKAKAALCVRDRAIGPLSHLQASGTITQYTIGAQSVDGAVTFVSATFTTSRSSAATTERFPVVQESGGWRVCFSSVLAAPGAIPSAGNSIQVPSFALPGRSSAGSSGSLSPAPDGTRPVPSIGPAGLCNGPDSGWGAADNYVGAAEIDLPDVAQACVYRNAVPESVTRSLAGKLFRPVTTDQNATVIVFQSSDRSMRVTVTTTREPDGRYYVTDVTIG